MTVVDGSGTMMPELRKPMRAMNSPTPAATAEYSSAGSRATIIWRTPAAVRIRNATPDRKTAPSATRQSTCILPDD